MYLRSYHLPVVVKCWHSPRDSKAIHPKVGTCLMWHYVRMHAVILDSNSLLLLLSDEHKDECFCWLRPQPFIKTSTSFQSNFHFWLMFASLLSSSDVKPDKYHLPMVWRRCRSSVNCSGGQSASCSMTCSFPIDSLLTHTRCLQLPATLHQELIQLSLIATVSGNVGLGQNERKERDRVWLHSEGRIVLSGISFCFLKCLSLPLTTIYSWLANKCSHTSESPDIYWATTEMQLEPDIFLGWKGLV